MTQLPHVQLDANGRVLIAADGRPILARDGDPCCCGAAGPRCCRPGDYTDCAGVRRCCECGDEYIVEWQASLTVRMRRDRGDEYLCEAQAHEWLRRTCTAANVPSIETIGSHTSQTRAKHRFGDEHVGESSSQSGAFLFGDRWCPMRVGAAAELLNDLLLASRPLGPFGGFAPPLLAGYTSTAVPGNVEYVISDRPFPSTPNVVGGPLDPCARSFAPVTFHGAGEVRLAPIFAAVPAFAWSGSEACGLAVYTFNESYTGELWGANGGGGTLTMSGASMLRMTTLRGCPPRCGPQPPPTPVPGEEPGPGPAPGPGPGPSPAPSPSPGAAPTGCCTTRDGTRLVTTAADCFRRGAFRFTQGLDCAGRAIGAGVPGLRRLGGLV